MCGRALRRTDRTAAQPPPAAGARSGSRPPHSQRYILLPPRYHDRFSCASIDIDTIKSQSDIRFLWTLFDDDIVALESNFGSALRDAVDHGQEEVAKVLLTEVWSLGPENYDFLRLHHQTMCSVLCVNQSAGKRSGIV